MGFIKKHLGASIGIGAALAVIGFLAFRPDKLVVDDTVSETLEEAFVTDQTVTNTSQSLDEPATTTGTAVPATTSTQPEPVGPVTVSVGSFYGIDHSAQGTATIYRQDDRYVLRFEDDTDIQNGPDLYVWLLPDDDFTGGVDPGYIDLGKLKGNLGGQNYQLPDDFDPDIHRSVLIWCLRFRVPFAAAPLG